MTADGPEPIPDARGRVTGVLPSGLYSLVLEDGREIKAHIATEMRLHNVRLLEGDKVSVAVSPFDPGRGRIVRRHSGVR